MLDPWQPHKKGSHIVKISKSITEGLLATNAAGVQRNAHIQDVDVHW